MKSISYILEGWWNLLLYNIYPPFFKKQNKLFLCRINICRKCNQLNKLKFCKICNCPIISKTKVIYKLDKSGKSIYGCPISKW
jgi:hypothetical protein